MKKIPFWGMLLFAATLFFSCQKETKLTDIRPAARGNETSLLAGEPTTIEALAKQYFSTHKDEAANEQKVVSVTNEFFAINQQTKEFKNKKPARIQPVNAYGIDGTAYYEVWFTEDNKTPQGWILISATNKDYPLVNFSQGTPYSSHMLTVANQDNKIYRFGVSYYTMEKDGQKIAEYGKMPTFIGNPGSNLEGSGKEDSKNPNSNVAPTTIEPIEGKDFTVINDYESLKQVYAKQYYTLSKSFGAQEMQNRIFPANGHGEAVNRQGKAMKATAQYNYRWVPGYKAYYTQIPGNTGYNYFPCWSGCNNNAWTNIYGWWDKNRAKGNLIPTTPYHYESSPLYRNTWARQQSVDPVQMYIRSISGTYCGGGTGWTYWYNTYKGVFYAPAKGYGYNYWYQWCNSAGCSVNLANIVTDGIANNYTPVYIGANSHAYVGLGWAQWSDNTDWTWAYCYPGWSENDNDNVWIWWRDLNASTRLFVY